jgi:hypothetical protein
MTIFHVPINCTSNQWIWEQPSKEPFNELIVSWNGFRPPVGFWQFSVSLFQNGWSPWLKYAQWGHQHQKTFRTSIDSCFAKTDQDVVQSTSGHCSAFRLQVIGQDGADLRDLHSITAAATDTAWFKSESSHTAEAHSLKRVSLPWIPHQSQMTLPHLRCIDLCSPTSTSSAINYLLRHKTIDPTIFAETVRDQEFDIYGNWVLNTAAAYEALHGKYRTYVARLRSFSEALKYIAQGMPLVVSIKGPLEGAPKPYASGHLMLLTGYDQNLQRVLCMDPGFPNDQQTKTSYGLVPFLEAWGRRRNLAYVFDRHINSPIPY